MPYPDFLLNFIMLCSIHVPRRPGSPRAALGLCIVGSGRGTSSRSRCSSKSWTTISTRGCGSTLIESVQGLRHDLGVHYRVRGGVCSREFGRVRSRACYRFRRWDLGRVGGRLASRRCGGVRRLVRRRAGSRDPGLSVGFIVGAASHRGSALCHAARAVGCVHAHWMLIDACNPMLTTLCRNSGLQVRP